MPRASKASAPKRKIPKTLGEVADLRYQVRQERLAAQRIADEIEAFEKELDAYIIDNLPKSSASGITGRFAKVNVYTKEVPIVEDWDALYKYITRNKAFELLQRRLAEKAITERWEAKKKVPGVGVFTAVKVSVTKA